MKNHQLAIFCIVLTLISYKSVSQDRILGFSQASSDAQKALEKKFDEMVTPSNLDQWMKKLAARPHHVGSPYGKENAEFMTALFRQWGFETEIETFQVLFPTPKLRSLEMIAPSVYKAGLEEPALKEDVATNQKKEQLPPYNGYSIDGDVTGDLVFVNYGVPEDYEVLKRMGVEVKGKIVIAKYFGSWRGIKPKVAAENGAIGCIIYSDPKEDGYYQGDVYPKGAYKNEHGVQRGSVMDMPLYPGDPLTPNIGATADAKRLDYKDAPTITKIPVLPISYKDAEPLLAALGGQVVPNEWKGALPITYHIGPGPAKVRLRLQFNWDLKPAYNVIARMRGTEAPDQWVIRGNHHDAWVNGANDPISGMVALMEEARVVGELAKNGWKPKRTIIYCAWDAEEPGLIGSTEWVEFHAEELKDKGAIYLNTDSNARGFLGAGGSHTLEKFFQEIANDVTDPQTGLTVAERRKAAMKTYGNPDYEKFTLYALGSGSDYTPFIQHLGIASLNVGFGGESGGGEYHSIYDTYDHYKRFKDPGFAYGETLAKVMGRATLRLANTEILPFEFGSLTTTVDSYLKEVMNIVDKMRSETSRHNQNVEKGYYKAAADPTLPFVEPEMKNVVPYFDFSGLQNEMTNLKNVVQKVDSKTFSMEPSSKLNKLLYQSERKLTLDEGLPRRPWFKHHIYAPGFYTGYGVKTLPGVREAIEQRDWEEVRKEIDDLEKVINQLSMYLESIIK